MKSVITISVIIPCYNSEKTIGVCIKSILSQSESVNEIIIVDDGSTDQSIKIIKESFKYSNVNFKLHEQKNSGPSIARNKGVELASSTHIAFMDSDDQWFLDHILISKQFLENNLEYKIAATKYSSAFVSFSGEITFKKLLLKNYFSTPCVVLDKDCFFENGGFNEKMKYSEDYNLWLNIAFKSRVYLLDYVGAQNVDYKRPFGDTGLSSNLFAMHKGVLQCYESLCLKGRINFKIYFVLKCVEKLKYFRRKILTVIYKK
ncbi:glycosyltransferase family 2 protein [Flavobacterium yafengii]|uniref:glycosyltransferase family 2 protein n=1 Tax=Flavobacterium yafengii TaxID=3041253 RepID=UPI0024A7EDA3|nr:glycosyltransferase family A protein [Flavobacterium yafengii]MDI6046656.1 glycosyltransferase family A protein [Flavobacterium yafengii]